jgi:lysophospholipase L1-like esterase
MSAPVVAFYGDSITTGTHSAEPFDWLPAGWHPSPVRHIAQLANIAPVDYSYDGASSMDAAIKADESTLVVIRFGVADTVHGLTPAQFGENIARLVAEARALGKRVLLTGLTHAGDVDTAPLDRAMRECAKSLGIAFADVHALPFGDGDLADGIHPAEGYSRRVGELVAAVIADSLGALSHQ